MTRFICWRQHIVRAPFCKTLWRYNDVTNLDLDFPVWFFLINIFLSCTLEVIWISSKLMIRVQVLRCIWFSNFSWFLRFSYDFLIRSNSTNIRLKGFTKQFAAKLQSVIIARNLLFIAKKLSITVIEICIWTQISALRPSN